MRNKGTVITLLIAAALVVLPGVALGANDVQERETIVGDVFPAFCGEEGETLVHTAGNLHIVMSWTENENRVSGSVHFNPQGAKLVDEAGNTYSGTGVFHASFSEPRDDGGAVSFTAVDSFKIIGHGSAPNFLLQGVVHATMNADGGWTADVDLLNEQCKDV